VTEVTLSDGRTLVVHDDSGDDGFPLLWHHGSPQTGALLAPVLEAARARGRRLIGPARPGSGGCSPQPGRKVASAAGDVAQLRRRDGHVSVLDVTPVAMDRLRAR
jgi:pimeloyl-ACP methyl ester carboxylesterase